MFRELMGFTLSIIILLVFFLVFLFFFLFLEWNFYMIDGKHEFFRDDDDRPRGGFVLLNFLYPE